MKRSLAGAAITALAAAVLTGCGSNSTSAPAGAKTTHAAVPSTSTSSPSRPTTSAPPSTSATLRGGSGGRISKFDLDEQIEKALSQKTKARTLVVCPHGLKGPVGNKVRCVINVPGGHLWAEAVVTHVYSDGIAYTLRHAKSPAAH